MVRDPPMAACSQTSAGRRSSRTCSSRSRFRASSASYLHRSQTSGLTNCMPGRTITFDNPVPDYDALEPPRDASRAAGPYRLSGVVVVGRLRTVFPQRKPPVGCGDHVARRPPRSGRGRSRIAPHPARSTRDAPGGDPGTGAPWLSRGGPARYMDELASSASAAADSPLRRSRFEPAGQNRLIRPFAGPLPMLYLHEDRRT
jgi:hypothetical protein